MVYYQLIRCLFGHFGGSVGDAGDPFGGFGGFFEVSGHPFEAKKLGNVVKPTLRRAMRAGFLGFWTHVLAEMIGNVIYSL